MAEQSDIYKVQEISVSLDGGEFDVSDDDARKVGEVSVVGSVDVDLADQSTVIADEADASGTLATAFPDSTHHTLYLSVPVACEITVELSPDGTHWFQIDESPVSFDAVGETAIEFGYTAAQIRITANVSDNITAILCSR
jgi:hypothetical protein